MKMKTFDKFLVCVVMFLSVNVTCVGLLAIFSDSSILAAASAMLSAWKSIVLGLLFVSAFGCLFFSTWLTTTDGRRAALGL